MSNKRRGRSGKSARFIAVPFFMLRSAAWRRLSPVDRNVWLEAAALYDGSNNGYLALSTRRIGELINVSHTTASRSIANLVTLGFLERTKASTFASKRTAAEFRLTHVPCDRTHQKAPKTFMRLIDHPTAAAHRNISDHHRCTHAPMKSGSSER